MPEAEVEKSAEQLALPIVETRYNIVNVRGRYAELSKGSWALAQAVKKYMMEVFVPDIHFGKYPGFKSAALLKDGACELLRWGGLVDIPEYRITYGDGVNSPEFLVECFTKVHVGSSEGDVIACSYGFANSFESKYRYITIPSPTVCPKCKRNTLRENTNPSYTTKFICVNRDCSAKFYPDKPDTLAINWVPARTEKNPDIFEDFPTVAAMAGKRALVEVAEKIFNIAPFINEVYNSKQPKS